MGEATRQKLRPIPDNDGVLGVKAHDNGSPYQFQFIHPTVQETRTLKKLKTGQLISTKEDNLPTLL